MVSGLNNGNSNGETSVTPKDSRSEASKHALDMASNNSGSDSKNSNFNQNSNNTTVLAPNNSQYNNNKNGYNSSNDQLNKHRICRDFLRGQCRRMFCKVCAFLNTLELL